jgi:ribosomal protein L11 methyltransferase
MFYSRLQVVCDPVYAEMLMAEIAEAGFDTFMENESGFEAFAEGEQFDRTKLSEIRDRYHALAPVIFYEDKIEKRNWNEEWEKSYEPIFVEDACLIRAHFHQIEKKYPYEIIITPKMSFGTGHHQTTYLMIKAQLQLDHQDKIVMDAGCGTAILSIMAEMRGASKVEAFDIDEWSVINGNENLAINRCQHVHIRQGKISDLTFDDNFDIVLANINKNILLQEMHQYAAYLKRGGLLLMSGFYTHDIPDLVAHASRFSMKQIRTDQRETWASLLVQKL